MTRRLFGSVALALLRLRETRGGPGSGEHEGHPYRGNQHGGADHHAGGRHHGRQAVAGFMRAAGAGFLLAAGRDTPASGYMAAIEPDIARELSGEGLTSDDLALFLEQHSDLLRDDATYFAVGADRNRATLLALRHTPTEPDAGDYFDLAEGSAT